MLPASLAKIIANTNILSEGTEKIVAGHYFEAKGDVKLGTIPPKEPVEKKVIYEPS